MRDDEEVGRRVGVADDKPRDPDRAKEVVVRRLVVMRGSTLGVLRTSRSRDSETGVSASDDDC